MSLQLKNFQQTEVHKPGSFTGKFYQIFREKLSSILLKLFQKSAEAIILLSSFYEVTITLISKPYKDTTKKKENFRLVSLMNTSAKILNKILANQSKQEIKRIVLHNQGRFIPGMQGLFNIVKLIV